MDKISQVLLIAAIAVALYYLYKNSTFSIAVRERYQDNAAVAAKKDAPSTDSTTVAPAKAVAAPREYSMAQGASVSEPSILNPNAAAPGGPTEYPGPFEGCIPKQSQLTPEELLPKDMNSKWAQANPAGQGNLSDRNFIDAGHHVGINTVGQSRRNANYSVRSEIPNPQIKVSPWLQSTIEPDVNRRPLEIGGAF